MNNLLKRLARYYSVLVVVVVYRGKENTLLDTGCFICIVSYSDFRAKFQVLLKDSLVFDSPQFTCPLQDSFYSDFIGMNLKGRQIYIMKREVANLLTL